MRRQLTGLTLTLATFAAAMIAWAGLVRWSLAPALSPEPTGFDWPRGWTGYLQGPDALRTADLHELLGFLALFTGFALAVAAVGAAALIAAGERARTRETAVRAAFGASPARLRRERLARRVRDAARTAVPVGLAAGAAALLAVRLGRPDGLEYGRGVDPVLVLLGAAAPVVAAATIAALPYSRRAARRPAALLLAGGRATRDRASAANAALLATLQIGASLALLSGAALLLRHEPAGADAFHATRDTMVATVRLAAADDAAHARDWAAIAAALRHQPDVAAAAVATAGSELGLAANDRLIIECLCSRGGMFLPLAPVLASQHAASPDWLTVQGLRVLEGRGIEETDDADGEPVALVNASLAAEFGGGIAIGRTVWLLGMDGPSARIVGVVENSPGAGLGAPAASRPALYLPAAQWPPASGAVLARGPDPAGVERALRDTIASAAPGARIVSLASLEQRVAEAGAPLRWFGRLFLALAITGTLIAAIGVAAAVRLEMRVRARELAIRAALGAAPAALRTLVRRHTLKLVARGAILGLVLALLVGRGLQESLTGVPLLAPAGTLIALAVLAAAALVGAAPAARGAGQTQPAEALAE